MWRNHSRGSNHPHIANISHDVTVTSNPLITPQLFLNASSFVCDELQHDGWKIRCNQTNHAALVINQLVLLNYEEHESSTSSICMHCVISWSAEFREKLFFKVNKQNVCHKIFMNLILFSLLFAFGTRCPSAHSLAFYAQTWKLRRSPFCLEQSTAT